MLMATTARNDAPWVTNAGSSLASASSCGASSTNSNMIGRQHSSDSNTPCAVT